jgi:type IV pilus assembly protein PilW
MEQAMAQLHGKRATPRREGGLSLIEILVGVVIGMIGIVVIFQVLAVTEDRKRTTVHGSDAQTSGAVALYQLQRDVQLGGNGFGMAHSRQLGCMVRMYDAKRPTDLLDFPLRPIEIADDLALPGSKTISVLWGNPNAFVVSPSRLLAWVREDAVARPTNFDVKEGRTGLD